MKTAFTTFVMAFALAGTGLLYAHNGEHHGMKKKPTCADCCKGDHCCDKCKTDHGDKCADCCTKK